MPKQQEPFTLRVRLLDSAVGAFMRAAHNFPGVIGVDIDLGHAEAPPHVAEALKAEGGSSSDKVVAYLRQHGPTKRVDIRKALHMTEHVINGAITRLTSLGLIKSLGKAVYTLTEINGAAATTKPLALPSPRRTANGRVGQGDGETALLFIVARQPGITRAATTIAMGEAGMSMKSVSGIVSRAKRDKLIKQIGERNNSTLELTAKGQHAVEAAANG